MANIDRTMFQPLIDSGYIREQHHPTLPLTILNYSAKTQYERKWTPETLMSRGLVIEDGTDKIVARPFRKFFNLSEMPEDWRPTEGMVTMSPKWDGSLLIVFFYHGDFRFATRGSFTSAQAIEGERIWRDQEATAREYDAKHTYLYEVIYPGNRIVVDYGDTRAVQWIGEIVTETGDEPKALQRAEEHWLSVGNFLAAAPEIARTVGNNSEGYVIRFADGERVKIKGDEYVRLHRILTGINERRVWEHMMSGESFLPLIENVPDEFHAWITSVRNRIKAEYEAIEEAAKNDTYLAKQSINARYEEGEFGKPGTYEEDKEFHHKVRVAFAELAKQTQYPHLVFLMADGKNYAKSIWRMVKPAGARADSPFKQDDDQ